MQEKSLFEYSVIRVMPSVDREEFFNVGVILYCAKQKFLKCLVHVNVNKLNCFKAEFGEQEVLDNLSAIDRICSGEENSGPIGQLDLASRFRWLTATRSTVVQCSKVHPGFCIDAGEKMQQIFQRTVL